MFLLLTVFSKDEDVVEDVDREADLVEDEGGEEGVVEDVVEDVDVEEVKVKGQKPPLCCALKIQIYPHQKQTRMKILLMITCMFLHVSKEEDKHMGEEEVEDEDGEEVHSGISFLAASFRHKSMRLLLVPWMWSATHVVL